SSLPIYSTLDQSRHWGVFVVGADTISYDLEVELLADNGLNQCASGLLHRSNGSDSVWQNPSAAFNQISRIASLNLTYRQQLAAAGSGFTTISTPPSLNLCTGESALLEVDSSAGFSY